MTDRRFWWCNACRRWFRKESRPVACPSCASRNIRPVTDDELAKMRIHV